MHRNKKKRNIIIFSLVGVLLCMVVGYAAFQTRLEIKGTSKVTSNWNILITNVTNGTPTGSAENAVKPSWKNTSASMEANLYDKGDAMEYDVTIENQGTIDAKLNDILTNLQNSNSEAVLITFSGYTKGEILKAGESKLIHVKIEYNPEYEGEETSSEVTIDFDYGQNNNETSPSDKMHLVTYDCTTNGGSACTSYNEYLLEGSNINLSHKGSEKKYYNFVGWNTIKDATSGLTTLTIADSDITLYAIYEEVDPTDPIIDNISTTSTTNSITVVVTAHDDESSISKYEYSIDGGKTWIDNGDSNTYTFTGLTSNTSYTVYVRVTNGVEKTANSNKDTITSTLSKPTFSEEGTTTKTVTITYPSGCGSTLTCTYQKDNGSSVNVINSSVEVPFTEDGNVVATVTDDTNTVSSSYTVSIEYAITTSKNEIVNLTISPNLESSLPGRKVTFEVPSSDDYTYQGSYIYDLSDDKIMELDKDTTSFTMPSSAVKIAPIFKHNDLTIMNRDVRDTTFTYKSTTVYPHATDFIFNDNYSDAHILTLMSNSSHYWDFGLVHTEKTYDLKYYDYITFDNNAEVIITAGGINNAVYLGVLQDLDKGLYYSFDSTNYPNSNGEYYNSITGMILRKYVDETRVSSQLDLTKLENQDSKYYIGFEFSTNYEASNLYIWSIILHGKTFYS